MRPPRIGIRGREAAHDVADDPDLDILGRVGEGEAAACAALVDRHLARLLLLAERMLGSRAEAEEVVQETFLRAWRAASGWRSGNARFSTWLHRVALNLCRDRLRRRRETALDPAVDTADEYAPHPGAALQRDAVSTRVAAALAALPERQRAAIVLCHYEELGNAAAAAALEVSVEALESLLARGRRRLRELLADEAADLVGDV